MMGDIITGRYYTIIVGWIYWTEQGSKTGREPVRSVGMYLVQGPYSGLETRQLEKGKGLTGVGEEMGMKFWVQFRVEGTGGVGYH